MKITKEHIGKRVVLPDRSGFIWEVKAIYEDWVWLYNEKTRGVETHSNWDDWQLYHKPFIVEGREVKAGDRLTKDHWASGYFWTVLDLSDGEFTAVDSHDGGRRLWPMEGPYWKFYQEKKLCAPAVMQCGTGRPYASINWFVSEEEAKKELGSFFVKWPAIPNKDGFYEV